MFNNIIGNEENKEVLCNMVKKNNISHSYIFSGVSGIGKFLFAKEFAKAILCTSETDKPCNICISCDKANNSNNPDIIIIDNQDDCIKTEQIKELINNIMEKPIQGNKKIYIINNSENMTKEAQNSLLKTLEEPPEYAIIILISNNENLLLNTIKSRCIKIKFNKLSNPEILKYFNMHSEVIDEKLLNIFDGSINNAINIKEKKDMYENIDTIFSNICNMNELDILKLKEEFVKYKEDINSLLEYINIILYNKILKDTTKINIYNYCIKEVEETKMRLKRNCNFDMTIDNFLYSIGRGINKNG